jgi:hypothetical protein
LRRNEGGKEKGFERKRKEKKWPELRDWPIFT